MTEKITREMTFREVLTKRPDAASKLMERGFHCVGCAMASQETLEEGAKSHGLSDKEIDELVKELNEPAKKE
jgi:hybrid cluster-associated redox disulfide protein